MKMEYSGTTFAPRGNIRGRLACSVVGNEITLDESLPGFSTTEGVVVVIVVEVMVVDCLQVVLLYNNNVLYNLSKPVPPTQLQ